MAGKPSSKNADGVYEPFPIEQVPWEEFHIGTRFGMRYQHLSSYGGGTQISIANEVLEPGRQANQLHYHMLEEEHVLVLDGALTLRLGERSFVLTAGDYVCFPAGQKIGHSLCNHTVRPCRYLIIGNPHPHEVAVFPETGRVSVKLTGEGYRSSATLGYWDGVDTGAPEAPPPVAAPAGAGANRATGGDGGVEFRRAVRADLPAIVALLADDPLGAKRERNTMPLPASYHTAFDAIERDPNQELIVADLGGRAIGVLQVTFIPGITYQGGWRALIEGVRIAAERRSGGVGERLVEHAIGRARERGCHLVQLTSDKARGDAIRFYEGLGFVASHEGLKLPL